MSKGITLRRYQSTNFDLTVRYLDTGIIDARIVRCLREAREFLYGSRSGGLPTSCQVQQIFTVARRRPVFDEPKEQLEFLTEERITAEEMAQLFGVSKCTVERRLSEFGLRLGEETTLTCQMLN